MATKMSDGAQRFPIPRASVLTSRRGTLYSAGSWTSYGTNDVPEYDMYGDFLNLDNLSPAEYRKLFKSSGGWCPNLDFNGKYFIGRKFKLPKQRNIFVLRVIMLSCALQLFSCAGVLMTILWTRLKLHLAANLVLYYPASVVMKSAVYMLVRIVGRGKFFPWNWIGFGVMVSVNLFASSVVAALMAFLGVQLLYLSHHYSFKATTTSSWKELNAQLVGNLKTYHNKGDDDELMNVTWAWEQLLSFSMISLGNFLCFIYIIITGMRRMTGDPTDDSSTALAVVPTIVIIPILILLSYLEYHYPLSTTILPTWQIIQLHVAFFRAFLTQCKLMGNLKLLFQGELDSIDADMWVYFTMRVNLHPVFLLL